MSPVSLRHLLVGLLISVSLAMLSGGTPDWIDIDRLISEQKFAEALEAVDGLLEEARTAGDTDNWTKALVRGAQLRMGLHGYEEAVRFLREQPRPDGFLSQAILNLYYGQTLATYYSAYSWEINQREAVSGEAGDVKTWTKEQIVAEATAAYEKVWAHRDQLGSEPLGRISEYVAPNNYPKGIRDTVRDAVSYLFVELLADTSLWEPEEENELYQLSAGELAERAEPDQAAGETKTHPLVRLTSLLKDLEAWHAAQGRPQAALEARLERMRRLHAAFQQDRTAIRTALEAVLSGYRDHAWWAMGQALLSEMVSQQSESGILVRARAIAEAGHQAYPGSPGGKRCLNLVHSIEAPDFQISSMAADGPQKRSIQVSHRNLSRVFFRAYRADLMHNLASARDYQLLLDGDARWELARSSSPVAEWTTDLPATPDFETHRTFVTPPLNKTGYYVILASLHRDFDKTPGNTLVSINFLVSDLVILTRRQWGLDHLEVQVLWGETGKPAPGARVDLYRLDWQRGHRPVRRSVSGADGTVVFEMNEDRSSYFVVARFGDQVALDPQYVYAYGTREKRPVTSAIVFTDRSIYRPGQKILWKILAYSGDGQEAGFRPLTGSEVEVTLLDANHQEVESRSVKTNEFGTAAGEFAAAAGRMLGAWNLRALDGTARVLVEEYKRPTFEASLKDPDTALRLNRPAVVKGEARYYFGLPLTTGMVKWRVTREPVYPWWWGWYGWGGGGKVQTVAAGTSELSDEGSFEVPFTPSADEREAKSQISYRYKVTADVTDEGGETQSAECSFRIGFVSVEARIEPEKSFFRETDPVLVRITRSDLNQAPRPGKGSWRLVWLDQPNSAVPPADLPLLGRPDEDEPAQKQFQTPGDRQRPRWDPGYSGRREMLSWANGAEKERGELDHDSRGVGLVELPSLEAGAYRLHYSTNDEHGQPFEASLELIVSGQRARLALPAFFLAEQQSCKVGETARFLAVSGLGDQSMFFEVYRSGRLIERRQLNSDKDSHLIEVPITEADRGGFSARLVVVRDHQLMEFQERTMVPWDNKELDVRFSTFRDKLRPGGEETWRVTIKDPSGKEVGKDAAEVLAYMYDRSLDVFAPHRPPSPLGLWPLRVHPAGLWSNLRGAYAEVLWHDSARLTDFPDFQADSLLLFEGYGVGGPGRRLRVMARMEASGDFAMAVAPGDVPPPAAAPAEKEAGEDAHVLSAPPPPALRSDFSETAFWQPQLLTGPDGAVSIEFKVPDSVTSWNIWVHGVTRDLLAGSLHKEARSVKDLMTRPYLPRFLREGDLADLKVVINNAGDAELQGQVTLEITDPETGESVLPAFGLAAGQAVKAFAVKPGAGTNVTFSLMAPTRVGSVAVKVVARAEDISDGEVRALPLLPGRKHLSQSRFVPLKNKDRRELVFEDLQKADDPTRINEQMVVTVDAQLFYSVLSSLPYLVNYPYECTEQTLNRFVSTGILSSLYSDYPAVAKMAKDLSQRETRLESFDDADPNRKMGLEETPWLRQARGGGKEDADLARVLDPRVAKVERDIALGKLQKAQTANGAFPWWPGGPPSPYMTLYIMYGLAKASEFGVEVPREIVGGGWSYLAGHFREEYVQRMIKDDRCWEFLTFLNYVASCYPDAGWMGEALTAEERKKILDFCFKHWKEHSPYLKSQLALTLKRMGRPTDAELVFASVMDSAKTTADEGTFWAPEDRGWLWYNDTIETHAFALRTLFELIPSDKRQEGLVQWLFLNKKLNHWKSTRATAEVIYSLVHYLKRAGTLGQREEMTVTIGPQRQTRLVFEPDRYTGKKNQIVVSGDEVSRETARVVVEKGGQGMMFASATWHFSTEQLPEEARGDLLAVTRRYLKREKTASGFALTPLGPETVLEPGDEVEVQLSIRAKHPCEYVHLRDPRPAGLEPGVVVSRFKWDLGIGWYEETRDSGTNFFFEWLPQGEYTFKYRLRANMAGVFQVSPATLQSMYAPEFTAYSSGAVVRIGRSVNPTEP